MPAGTVSVDEKYHSNVVLSGINLRWTVREKSCLTPHPNLGVDLQQCCNRWFKS